MIELVKHRDYEYKVMNGTYYVKGTPDEVVRVLEYVRQNGQRVHIFYGQSDTGRDWLEESDVTGTISRSMGPVKTPILVNNSRSMGGSVMLTGDIVRIVAHRTELYRHPTYHLPQLTVNLDFLRGQEYSVAVFGDGEHVASFKTEAQANNWIAFMKGERGAK